MSGYKRVLAATDGTEHGKRAVVTGAALAGRIEAEFHIVTVAETTMLPPVAPVPGWAANWLDLLDEQARNNAEVQAREAGAADAPIHAHRGLAAPLIMNTARELQADILVLGAHRQPAVARSLLGSTAEKVARMAECPVLVATEPRSRPFARILVAVDVSPHSRQVLENAARIAVADDAKVRALHVHEMFEEAIMHVAMMSLGDAEHRAAEIEESVRRQLERYVEDVKDRHGIVAEERVRMGAAGPQIIEEAEEWDADLLIMGTHGHGFFHRLVIGSRSLHVLRHLERTTMLVPRLDAE